MARAKLIGSPEVEIVLSYKEAETLQALLKHVGGHPVLTRRGHIDSVRGALLDVLGTGGVNTDISGAIHFSEVEVTP